MHLVNSVHFVELCLVKKDSGQPNNTKASDGYAVSSGIPTNATKASDVGTNGGRPSGTRSL